MNIRGICSVLAVGLAVVAASCASPPEPFGEEAWRGKTDSVDPQTLYLPNQENGRFFNPWLRMPDNDVFRVLRWKLFTKAENSYTEEESTFLPAVVPDAAKRMSEASHRDYILWVGHNTFAVKIGSTLYLTDPMFSDRAVLPKRKTPPAVGVKEIASLGMDLVVILSHPGGSCITIT